MRRSKIDINLFLELQKAVGVKLSYKDACNATVIEITENRDDETIKKIQEFFDNKGIEIEFSNDKKYIFEKK